MDLKNGKGPSSRIRKQRVYGEEEREEEEKDEETRNVRGRGEIAKSMANRWGR